MAERRPLPVVRIAIQLALVVGLMPLLPMLVSGRWRWVEGWIYAGIFAGGFVVSRLLVLRRNPDLLEERARFGDHKDAKRWDKVLAPLVAFGSALFPIVAGIEARRGAAVTFGLPCKVAAVAAILAGYVIATLALLANRNFSGMVRIQTDRGHAVASGGPYALVRHPGYLGSLIAWPATSLLLDSVWSLLPVAALCVALVVRTGLEDRTLQEELEGYRDYAARVRYRLVPGLW